MPRGELRTEDLLQIIFVRPVRVTGLARHALKHTRDARQFQRARVREHEIPG
jgi:hypothetical protein